MPRRTSMTASRSAGAYRSTFSSRRRAARQMLRHRRADLREVPVQPGGAAPMGRSRDRPALRLSQQRRREHPAAGVLRPRRVVRPRLLRDRERLSRRAHDVHAVRRSEQQRSAATCLRRDSKCLVFFLVSCSAAASRLTAWIHLQAVRHNNLCVETLDEIECRHALEFEPDFPDAWVNLGLIAQSKGDLVAAREDYIHRPLRLNNEQASAYNDLGVARPQGRQLCARRTAVSPRAPGEPRLHRSAPQPRPGALAARTPRRRRSRFPPHDRV